MGHSADGRNPPEIQTKRRGERYVLEASSLFPFRRPLHAKYKILVVQAIFSVDRLRYWRETVGLGHDFIVTAGRNTNGKFTA